MQLKLDNSPSIYRKGDRSYEQITDASIVAIAQQCSQLRVFSLSRSSAVTSVAIQAIASGCPFMTSLSLNYCGALGDQVLDAVLGMKWLRCLTLQNCDVTPQGVCYVSCIVDVDGMFVAFD